MPDRGRVEFPVRHAVEYGDYGFSDPRVLHPVGCTEGLDWGQMGIHAGWHQRTICPEMGIM